MPNPNRLWQSFPVVLTRDCCPRWRYLVNLSAWHPVTSHHRRVSFLLYSSPFLFSLHVVSLIALVKVLQYHATRHEQCFVPLQPLSICKIPNGMPLYLSTMVPPLRPDFSTISSLQWHCSRRSETTPQYPTLPFLLASSLCGPDRLANREDPACH